MAYTQHASAGVYVREIDLSERIATVATSIGAIVGASNKGPVMERTLITSTKQFVDVFGIPDVRLGYMHYSALAFLAQSQNLYVTRVANGAKFGGIACSIVGNFNVSVPFTAGFDDPSRQYMFSSNDLFIIYGRNPGVWNNNLSIAIRPADPTDISNNQFWVEIYEEPSNVPSEKFLCTLNSYVDGYGNQLNIADQINMRSTLVYAVQNVENPAFAQNNEAVLVNAADPVVTMAGGSDGTAINDSHILSGWTLYEDPEVVDINILINGGYTSPPVQTAMDALCQSRMDCMAILDVPSDQQGTSEAIQYRRYNLSIDSSYSALYSPDLYVTDQFSGKKLYVPPSGYVAAVYAKTDAVAAPWYAPAGMNRGSLNILGVRHVYDQGMRDMLSANQINSMRVIYGAGIKVWDSLTLQSRASALSEVNVRRLMILLEKSISIAALYSVYEPNDAVLWARLRDLCSRFLDPIKRGRGIYDYAVICDETNNTYDLIASGDTVLDVYIDPALPVKRIHLNAIISKTGGLQFAISQMNASTPSGA